MIDLIAQNSTLRTALLLALFLLVTAAVFIVTSGASERRITRQRLVGDGPGSTLEGDRVAGSLRSRDNESAWARMVDAIERSGLSLADTKDAGLRRKLGAAGYSAPYAPRAYTLIRLILVVAVPLLLLMLMWVIGSSPSVVRLYVTLVLGAMIGLYVPSMFIRMRAARRHQELVNAFPDALDLMLVCVEAGLGLEAAFSRVGQEMTTSHPLLAEQLGAVVFELRAGRTREDALRRMADRAGADEIRAFSTLLIQSTKLGSSIAQTLRIYASEMRERRRMRAEEKAHRLPVLLSIPLVTCMLPVMIGVLMLPAAIRVIRSIVPALNGGG